MKSDNSTNPGDVSVDSNPPAVVGYNSSALAAAGSFGVIINAIALLFLFVERRMKTPLKVLILCQAMSDILYMAVPTALFISGHFRIESGPLCYLLMLTMVTMVNVSLIVVSILAALNYCCVAKPLAFQRTITIQKVSMLSALAFAISILVSVSSLRINLIESTCLPPVVIDKHGFVILSVSFSICTILLVGFNAATVHSLRKLKTIWPVSNNETNLTRSCDFLLPQSNVVNDRQDRKEENLCSTKASSRNSRDIESQDHCESSLSNISSPNLCPASVRSSEMPLSDSPIIISDAVKKKYSYGKKDPQITENNFAHISCVCINTRKMATTMKSDCEKARLRSQMGPVAYKIITPVGCNSVKETCAKAGKSMYPLLSVPKPQLFVPRNSPPKICIKTSASASIHKDLNKGADERKCSDLINQNAAETTGQPASHSSSRRPIRRLRSTITLVILSCWCLFFNLPFIFYMIWQAVAVTDHMEFLSSRMSAVCVPMNFIGTLGNPFLYAWRFVDWPLLKRRISRLYRRD